MITALTKLLANRNHSLKVFVIFLCFYYVLLILPKYSDQNYLNNLHYKITTRVYH